MKENEDFLDELLRSMGEEEIDLSGWESDSIDESMISIDAMSVSKESDMGPMDQAMIDALLASAGNSDVGIVEDMPVLVDEADLDAFLAAESVNSLDDLTPPMLKSRSRYLVSESPSFCCWILSATIFIDYSSGQIPPDLRQSTASLKSSKRIERC